MEGEARLMVWIMALGLEYVAPSLGFRVPNLGRSKTGDWDVEGAHLAERCGLFVIIALGESILVTGATFAEAEINLLSVSAFLTAFVGTIAMWWIYFDVGAERSAEHIANQTIRESWHGRPIPIRICWRSPASWCARWPTNWCSPTWSAIWSNPAIAAMIGGPALHLAGAGLFRYGRWRETSRCRTSSGWCCWRCWCRLPRIWSPSYWRGSPARCW